MKYWLLRLTYFVGADSDALIIEGLGKWRGGWGGGAPPGGASDGCRVLAFAIAAGRAATGGAAGPAWSAAAAAAGVAGPTDTPEQVAQGNQSFACALARKFGLKDLNHVAAWNMTVRCGAPPLRRASVLLRDLVRMLYHSTCKQLQSSHHRLQRPPAAANEQLPAALQAGSRQM
jgi:hypothetical protein